MLFQKNILKSGQIAIKDDYGNVLTYREAYNEAKQMRELFGKRSLISVLCSKSFVTASFLLKMFILNQPMILIAENADTEYLDRIQERFNPRYFWNGKELISYNFKSEEAEIHKDLALLLATTGTTGNPKLARISYQNLREEIKTGIETFHIQSNQKGIQILPLEHVYGLAFCLYHWYCGACLVVTREQVISNQFAELFDREIINNFAGIPFHYRILKKINFWSKPERKANLNCALTCGAKLSKDEQYWYVSMLGRKFKLCYGQTEVTPTVVVGCFDNPESKLGTIGREAMNVKASVDNNNELWIQSPAVCMGYASDAKDLRKGDENRGIIATGDLAEIDADGYIFLKGRIRRFVKILGNRIGLDDIEELLRNNMSGQEFVCTGEDDELNVYYTEPAENIVQEKCSKVLYEKADIPLSMVRYYRIEEIPRNATGKVLYSKLR